MDKYEYKIRSEEIRALIAKKEYAEAAELADTIDWRRVKSVMMLCTISDLYKINRRYEDARDMLLLAYDRHPGGRSIVYSLCELSIKMEEFVQAVEYYKEFVQVAPKDSGRYVLQYKLYEAQEVSLEERIAVLEELKAKDYTEKWAYELAYLYHRIGLGTRCVEECDELVLWFGEGKYVLKALELKSLHESLTEEQQEKYEIMKGLRKPVQEQTVQPADMQEDLIDAPTKVIPQDELDIQVKLMNVGQYDTINIQKELAQNMKELWEGPIEEENISAAQTADKPVQEVVQEEPAEEDIPQDDTLLPESDTGEIFTEETITETEIVDELEPLHQENRVEEVFFGETGEIDITGNRILEEMKQEVLAAEKPVVQDPAVQDHAVQESAVQELPTEEPVAEELVTEEAATETIVAEPEVKQETEQLIATKAGDMTEWHVTPVPAKFDKILGMDYDGQISMVMPESEQIEKQITGQIRLEDVLLEWEKMKKDSEQKRMEAVRQRVKEQTGAMFTEFDESVRDGLLEQLENGTIETVDDEMVKEAFAAATPTFTEGEAPEELAGEELDLGELGVVPAMSADVIAQEVTSVETADDTVTDNTDSIEEPEEFEDLEEIEEIASEETVEETLEEDVDIFTGEEMFPEESAETEETVEAEPEETTEPETVEAEAAEPEIVEAEIPEPEIVETETNEPETAEAENAVEEDAVEEETVEEIMQESAETEEVKPAETKETAESETETSAEEPVKSDDQEKEEKEEGRKLSPEENQLFAGYIQNKATRAQIIHAIDNISLAAYAGNVVITGDEGMDTLTLAKNLVKEVQQTDSNFSGKIAKISGTSLNQKDVTDIVKKLANGALILQKAGTLKKETAEALRNALEQDENGIIVVMEDSKKAINKLFKNSEALKECFPIRIDVEPLDNATLVAMAKEYAREKEYSIDEMGVLALHTCIADRQTSDHIVTVDEVKELIDDAIWSANRKTIGHFFDVLLAKRYDDEDMIILREKDFI